MEMYKLALPTSSGDLSIPQLGGQLTLNGKDSKVHVVDYIAGSTHLLYSTGEIMTWYIVPFLMLLRAHWRSTIRATIDGRDVIVVYGNAGELHETAFKFNSTNIPGTKVVSGMQSLKTGIIDSTTLVVQYTTSDQTVVEVGPDILMYILGEGTFSKACGLFLTGQTVPMPISFG